MRRLLLVTALCFCSLFLADAAEQVWIHCDRSLYAAGETVWLRGWVTEAGGSGTAADSGSAAAEPTSKFLYVELLRDGIASVEKRIKLKERGGMFIGQMELPDDLDSGWYTLRAYTRAQKKWPAELLFHTRLLIRGAGPVPGMYADVSAANSGTFAEDVRVEMAATADGHMAVSLTDAGGQPVAGNFSISVVRSRYADFDFQAIPAPAAVDETLDEGGREYAQELDFRVKSVRNRLPDKYEVAIMSQDIGYYYSTEVAGDRKVKGEEGQSFRIPDLDFPEGTLFTVNTSGSRFIFPGEETESFAEPFDYGPTYPVREEIRDTVVIMERFEGTVAPLPADDTITASKVTAERKPVWYKHPRTVGPYSNLFEWRQVRLRDDLKKYDDMDLLTYISANFPGLYVSGSDSSFSRSMYTTRSSSFRMTVSHGVMKYSAGYNPVGLYIDGTKEPDWTHAATLSVRDVQNLFVLRGAEAALYKVGAVVLLELRRFDESMIEEARKNELKTTIGLLPLGWQKPKSFDSAPALNPDRQGTIYWNPCIRTDASGHADIALPAITSGKDNTKASGLYIRLEGRTLDGRWFSAVSSAE